MKDGRLNTLHGGLEGELPSRPGESSEFGHEAGVRSLVAEAEVIPVRGDGDAAGVGEAQLRGQSGLDDLEQFVLGVPAIFHQLEDEESLSELPVSTDFQGECIIHHGTCARQIQHGT